MGYMGWINRVVGKRLKGFVILYFKNFLTSTLSSTNQQ